MYTEREFKKQIKLLHSFYKKPIQGLKDLTGFSRPTIVRYLNGIPLRSYNQDKLNGAVIQMNEEAVAFQKSIAQRGRSICKEASKLKGIQPQH